jgi:hypothetical protein
MAAKKAPAGPERVHSKSFNGSKRATVLRRLSAPKADSYFGAEFALVEFDHFPEPIWSSQKFLAKPTRADLYERWRAAPLDGVKALVGEDTETVIRTCARISGGQSSHHDGGVRWVGLVRRLPLAEGTEALLTLLERLRADPAAEDFEAPHALDGSEYNKSDFKYGPSVRGNEVFGMLVSGLTRYWPHAVGGQETTVAEALPPALRARVEAVFADVYEGGRKYLREPLARPTFREAFMGTSRQWNERCGLDPEFAMVGGTGY